MSLTSWLRWTLRIGILCSDRCAYLPASAYFETPGVKQLFDEVPASREAGLLRLVGSAASLPEFLEAKRRQYSHDRERYPLYFSREAERLLLGDVYFWTRRSANSTLDISHGWRLSVARGDAIWHRLSWRNDVRLTDRRLESLYKVPYRLEEAAFIAPYVARLVPFPTPSISDVQQLNRLITSLYVDSFLRDLDAACLSNLPFVDSLGIGTSTTSLSLERCHHIFRAFGLLGYFQRASDDEVVDIHESGEWNAVLRAYVWPEAAIIGYNYAWALFRPGNWHRSDRVQSFEELLSRLRALLEDDGAITSIRTRGKGGRQVKGGTGRVFIVHGRDSALKYELKNFLQNRLGLPEPIILHEQMQAGRVLMEKFEDYASQADAALVLLTPDDEWLEEGTNQELQRARQNVIFELGYFLALLARRSGRVVLLHKGKLDLPTDIAGLGYIDVTNGIEAAGEKIRLELAWLTP